MAWNFNISEAPKGHYEDVTRAVGKNTVTSSQHVPQRIIAAGNGGVVTTSRWLPDEERWEMFTKAVPPLAWQIWPDHPHQEATQ
jgi:hypothetical protein